MASIRNLCSGIHDVYINSAFSVPIVERVALLDCRDSTESLVEEGTVVKVRTGRYRGDVGTVVKVMKGSKSITLNVQSREPMPGDLKRKKTRREAYTLRKKVARELGKTHGGFQDLRAKEYGNDVEGVHDDEEMSQALNEKEKERFGKDKLRESFKFNGQIYSGDGHLLLHVARDRVEPLRSSAFFDDTIDPRSPVVSHTKFPALLSVGGSVWVKAGEETAYGFRTGRIVEITSSATAIVAVEKPSGTSNSSTIDDLLLEMQTKNLVRIFNIGERVQVKVGPNMGLLGDVAYVELKNGFEKAILHILFDAQMPNEVRVVEYQQYLY